MSNTEMELFRSVRVEAFPNGTVIEGKPAPEVLYPDFEPRVLPNGRKREADVQLSGDKTWVYSGGGTSLFDRPNVFKRSGWLAFTIPAGTEVPESLAVRYTGRNPGFDADHYQIESKAHRMRLDAYKGALDNLARNAVVKSIELAERGKRT
ncbi:hypothetical protein [Aquabacterium sp.]|uniref:Tse2 family ADP-ribosyltransferase toxin n=1 Tax=Aquabacterium sp. TaxID=1872578 RepID=UPI0035AE588A